MGDSERAKEMVLRMVEQPWNGHELDVAGELFLEAFETARAEERAMSFEQVAAYALKRKDDTVGN